MFMHSVLSLDSFTHSFICKALGLELWEDPPAHQRNPNAMGIKDSLADNLVSSSFEGPHIPACHSISAHWFVAQGVIL